MNRRIAGEYAGVTSALLVALLLSWQCWQYQSGPGSNWQLHDSCLDIWLVTAALLGVSQLVFAVMAVRRKHYVILVPVGIILLCMAAFLVLLAHLPS